MNTTLFEAQIQAISQELRTKMSNNKGEFDGQKWKGQPVLKASIQATDIQDARDFDEKVWFLWHHPATRPLCAVCGKPTRLVTKMIFRTTCSVKCAAQNSDRIERIKQTNLERYGGHPMNTETVKNKLRQVGHEKYQGKWPGSFGTNENKAAVLAKYGVENVFQVDSVKEKIKQTMFNRYGVENARQIKGITERIRETCLSRYGVDHPMKTEMIKNRLKLVMIQNYGVGNPQKYRPTQLKTKITIFAKYGKSFYKDIFKRCANTQFKKYGYAYFLQNPLLKIIMKERYGVEHNSQVPELVHKRAISGSFCGTFRRKEFTLPSGRIIRVMGYEPQVISHLLENGYTEDDIDWESNLRIPYGDNKVYLPDIFIPKDNLIIEVKSHYTYNRDILKNEAKRLACLSLDYNFKFYFWCPKSKQITSTM